MDMLRRQFLHRGTVGAFGTLVGAPLLLADMHGLTSPDPLVPMAPGAGGAKLAFSQAPLPYAYEALEPHIDAQTMRLHYDKHHAKYVEEANKELALADTGAVTAEALFARISKLGKKLRNNAGGAWNHDFFWQSMRPATNAQEMPADLREALTAAFGSVETFREKFAEEALARFGSGWVWLVTVNGKLEFGSTADQDNPLMDDSPLRGTPLLGLDVWEHAYYLRYQNKRADYISNWWNVVDHDAIAQRLSRAK